MASAQRFLAFDLGASNGRAVVGEFDGSRLQCEDIYHFPNEPVHLRNNIHWDFLRLMGDIRNGIAAYVRRYGPDLDGIGIDTWGVDFGLLDEAGNLVGNPHHYRDRRNIGMLDEIDAKIGCYNVYASTGVRLEPISTLCQLYSLTRSRSCELRIASRFLMMPSLFGYYLTGECVDEHSSLSASGLYDCRSNSPAVQILDTLGIPAGLIPRIVMPGSIIGDLLPSVREELGIGPVPVIAPATHDSASTVIAVPADYSKNWAFLSCGTWSVLGIETDSPVTSRESYDAGITNATTAGGKFMTRSNITGLWLLQECTRTWGLAGEQLDYATMVDMAKSAPAFTALINVDDPVFASPGDMPKTIASYCRRTSQPEPHNKGTLIRVILESLTLRYRAVIDNITRCTGKHIDLLHIVGGGARNAVLCQCAANALRMPVLAGPIEGTSLGNIIMQMVGTGAVGSLEEGRTLLRESFELVRYEPGETDAWDAAYERYKKVLTIS
jgi:sugar (pentulose or hexulose) kinase